MRALMPVTATLLIGASAFVPARSEACSCYSPGEHFIAPATDAANVPTNTKIWSGRQFGASIELIDKNFAPVAVTESKIQGVDSAITVLTPVQPLILGETYTVRGGGSETLSTFTVSVRGDDSAPPVPSELAPRMEIDEGPDFELFGGSSCGNEGHYAVVVQLQHEGIFSMIDIGAATTLDADAKAGLVTTFGFESQVSLGSGICQYNWAGAKDGDDTTLRFATFDLAGNFSGWSGDTRLESPNKGCTCVSAPRSDFGVSLGLIVGTGLLLAIARKRRRR